MSLKIFRIALIAGTFGLAASAASGQDRDSYRNAAYAPDGTETVIVNPPHEWMRRHADGTVTLSREVSYADLDLSTRGGARELRQRIRFTARDVCEELNDRAYDPINRMDVGRCARDAYQGAMRQAHGAIADARYDDDAY